MCIRSSLKSLLFCYLGLNVKTENSTHKHDFDSPLKIFCDDLSQALSCHRAYSDWREVKISSWSESLKQTKCYM